MEQHTHEPEPPALSTPSYVARHDGWTGEKMAIFCETLAESAVVTEACFEAGMGISGAYAARRRNPVFAAAWDAALTIARERLADTLLGRAMEGNVEQIWRDGVVVGERHLLDNRLGLALLRRLDRLADTGLSTSSRGVRGPDAPAPRSETIDWSRAVDALRDGNDEEAARALALIEGNKVEEVEGPPDSFSQEDDEQDLSHRCWFDEDEEVWMTDFPPPAGFSAWESRDYDDLEDPDPYVRNCTAEEVAILKVDAAAERAAERAEEEALRDDWFALLRSELPSAGEQSRSNCEPASKSQRAAASGAPSGEPD